MTRAHRRIKLSTDYGDDETFTITYNGDQFVLTVEPEYRRNGTQNYDGYFPRYCSTIGSAKASLTRFMGKPPNPWREEK